MQVDFVVGSSRMIIRRLAVLGVAMAACGAAWGQAPPPDFRLSPPYEDMLSAVAGAGCDRKETRSYIRFFCEKGQAAWYFTRAGRLEHPGYKTLPAYRVQDRDDVLDANRGLRQIDGFGRFDSAEKRDAYMAWMREVFVDLSESTSDPGIIPKFKREPRGKLYPLEP